jgi:hypothetical protein
VTPHPTQRPSKAVARHGATSTSTHAWMRAGDRVAHENTRRQTRLVSVSAYSGGCPAWVLDDATPVRCGRRPCPAAHRSGTSGELVAQAWTSTRAGTGSSREAGVLLIGSRARQRGPPRAPVTASVRWNHPRRCWCARPHSRAAAIDRR